jgi:hypothetical protein
MQICPMTGAQTSRAKYTRADSQAACSSGSLPAFFPSSPEQAAQAATVLAIASRLLNASLPRASTVRRTMLVSPCDIAKTTFAKTAASVNRSRRLSWVPLR